MDHRIPDDVIIPALVAMTGEEKENEVVRYLQKDMSPVAFPRVGKSYGELKISRRQKTQSGEEIRSDMELAKWFVHGDNRLDEDIFEKLQGNQCGQSLSFKRWKTNEPCQIISKELIYTAISRQTERLVILYNNEPYKLRNYSALDRSAIARRFTNLFERPDIVKVKDKYFEAGLIHRTLHGELVRSKSEVIIANLLNQNGIDYEYEKELWIDNTRKISDFTMDDPESGELIYWEHCGMIRNDIYRKNWLEKKHFYELNGIIEGENLIVTYDNENGSIDSQEIQKQIDQFLN